MRQMHLSFFYSITKRMEKMKKIFCCIIICFAGILCCACGEEIPQRYKSADAAMGTVVQLVLYDTGDGEAKMREIMALLQELEKERISRRLPGSELYEVNQAAGREEGYRLSPELEANVAECLEVWERSEGAFDITLGQVAELWNIDSWAAGEREEEFALPDRDALRNALEHSGSGKLRMEGGTLFLPEDVSLDLGAVGKGISMDEILSYLEQKGTVTGAVISLGGSVLTYGEKPEDPVWKVGIRDPFNVEASIGVLSLEGQWCVSTSGDYERYAEKDGIRYHHILDPATGCPADSGVASVTILSKDGFLSDALSTACFILGPEEGIRLAESYGAEALFVRKDGSLEMSAGMKKYWKRL